MANVLIACFRFVEFSSVLRMSLTLLQYSFLILSFMVAYCIVLLSLTPRYLFKLLLALILLFLCCYLILSILTFQLLLLLLYYYYYYHYYYYHYYHHYYYYYYYYYYHHHHHHCCCFLKIVSFITAIVVDS